MVEQQKNDIKSGFTMVSDFLMWKYQDANLARVYGKIYRFTQIRDSGVCTATVNTLAKELLLGKSTVEEKIKLLEDEGYLLDKTPKRVNSPHVRKVTSKLEKEEAAFWLYEALENKKRELSDTEDEKREFYECFKKYALQIKLEPFVSLYKKEKPSRGKTIKKNGVHSVDSSTQ